MAFIFGVFRLILMQIESGSLAFDLHLGGRNDSVS